MRLYNLKLMSDINERESFFASLPSEKKGTWLGLRDYFAYQQDLVDYIHGLFSSQLGFSSAELRRDLRSMGLDIKSLAPEELTQFEQLLVLFYALTGQRKEESRKPQKHLTFEFIAREDSIALTAQEMFATRLRPENKGQKVTGVCNDIMALGIAALRASGAFGDEQLFKVEIQRYPDGQILFREKGHVGIGVRIGSIKVLLDIVHGARKGNALFDGFVLEPEKNNYVVKFKPLEQARIEQAGEYAVKKSKAGKIDAELAYSTYVQHNTKGQYLSALELVRIFLKNKWFYKDEHGHDIYHFIAQARLQFPLNPETDYLEGLLFIELGKFKKARKYLDKFRDNLSLVTSKDLCRDFYKSYLQFLIDNIKQPEEAIIFAKQILEHDEKVLEDPDPGKFSEFQKKYPRKYRYDKSTKTIVVIGKIKDAEAEILKDCFSDNKDKDAIERLFQRAQGSMPYIQSLLCVAYNELAEDPRKKGEALQEIEYWGQILEDTIVEIVPTLAGIRSVHTKDALIVILKNNKQRFYLDVDFILEKLTAYVEKRLTVEVQRIRAKKEPRFLLDVKTVEEAKSELMKKLPALLKNVPNELLLDLVDFQL